MIIRKLPVYLLLDTSGSMAGAPIEQVKYGLEMLIADLRQDPYALETVYLSIITFNSRAEQTQELTSVLDFEVPELKAGGQTAMGTALKLVTKCAMEEVSKRSENSSGDWKPIFIIMTDGVPTDDWKSGLDEFRKVKWGIRIACAVDEADRNILQEIISCESGADDEIPQEIVTISTANPGEMGKLFAWLSQTVRATNNSVGCGETSDRLKDVLPPPPPEIDIEGL